MRASDEVPDLSHAVSVDMLGIAGISVVTFVVLGLTLLTALYDREYSARTHELETAEKRYRLLFERSLAGVLRTTLDGRILDCNEACARIFGFASREEMIGTSMKERYVEPGGTQRFRGGTGSGPWLGQLRMLPAPEGWQPGLAPGHRHSGGGKERNCSSAPKSP